nr:hypothetical protein [Tanacetum cinerariifolium]
MANSNNPYASPAPHQDLSPFNQNFLQQPMTNPEDITDPTTAMNMALALMAKAFKLNYSTPTNNNQRISSNPRNKQIAQPGNLNGYNAVQNVRNQVAQKSRVQNVGIQNELIGIQGNGIQNQIGNGNLAAVRAERNAAGHNGNHIRCYNCRNQVAQNSRVQNVGIQNELIGIQGNGIQNQIGNGNLVAVRAERNAAGHNGNHIRCYNCRRVGRFARDCTVRPRRRDAAYLQTQLLIAQKEEAGI